ncbi:MAG: FAD-binding protein, partial [Yaniella sp.]|uniref:FAD-binding protein n=1 Tax=Yaniella sp. TaxID=2773929 RepID=UPI003F98C5B9
MPENLLAHHTTARVGGPASTWITVSTEDQLTAAIADADAAGTPLLVLAGGSNMLVSDAGFPGTVVHLATEGIDVIESTDE